MRWIKLIVVGILLSVSTAKADSIWIGHFADQPVIWQGVWTGFYSPGTIQQTNVGYLDSGPRYLLTTGWHIIPLGMDWVTRDSTFTARLADGTMTLTDPFTVPLMYGAATIHSGGPLDLTWTDTDLTVSYLGYRIGTATLTTTAVSEPIALVLLAAGLIALRFRARQVTG